ncbi:MAG: hypothetical protein SPG09_03880 [Lachnospiraceae bacterium]|nr:hypothetical protein [bacterium]MDY5516736.1 hypothetical protein [Lachnospiraceae bacterium]
MMRDVEKQGKDQEKRPFDAEYESDFEADYMERMKCMLENGGFARVMRASNLLRAWIPDVVEGKDWKIPMQLTFLPYEASKEDQRIVLVRLTLAKNVKHVTDVTRLSRLMELGEWAVYGHMGLSPEGEMYLQYCLPLAGRKVEQALNETELALEEIILFLMDYYVYLLILAENPSQMTLEQYQEIYLKS